MMTVEDGVTRVVEDYSDSIKEETAGGELGDLGVSSGNLTNRLTQSENETSTQDD